YPVSPGTVTPIRIATNTPLPPIKTGALTADIAITPDGNTANVPTPGPIDETPRRSAPTTPLPPTNTVGPNAAPTTPDALPAGTVTPIRIATNTALPPIKTGLRPIAIAITP